jgi:predicted transcriptional regulator
MNTIIEAKGLTKAYQSPRVVDAASFAVGEGDVFSLLGPNGAGKTTTITKLSYGVGVPVDRLKLIVERLCSYGLANKSQDEAGAYYGVTPRGVEFLDVFWKMKGFLEEFGRERS